MHGPTRRCGSVASIRNIKNPSKVAKLVMEQTDHVMLVGPGALEFAKAWGFKEEELLTEKSRLAWLVWKQSLRDGANHNNWTDGLDAPEGSAKPAVPKALQRRFPNADQSTLAWAYEMSRFPPTGTINCLALNRKGEMSGCTTTSGLAWKIAGRVGDSPIIGAGPVCRSGSRRRRLDGSRRGEHPCRRRAQRRRKHAAWHVTQGRVP